MFGNFTLKIVWPMKYARYLVLDAHAHKEIGMQEESNARCEAHFSFHIDASGEKKAYRIAHPLGLKHPNDVFSSPHVVSLSPWAVFFAYSFSRKL